jgi:hypothetical protein
LVGHPRDIYSRCHREPRSGVAIQYQRLGCFVGGCLLAMTKKTWITASTAMTL